MSRKPLNRATTGTNRRNHRLTASLNNAVPIVTVVMTNPIPKAKLLNWSKPEVKPVTAISLSTTAQNMGRVQPNAAIPDAWPKTRMPVIP